MAELLTVPSVEAVAHFRAKGLHVGFDWRDTDAETHLRSFTAAKAMREDVLFTLRTEVDRAIAEGTTFAQFREALEPRLQKLGWWGRQEVTDPLTGEIREVEIGPRRLRTIFDTNLRASYARGRWERIERTAEVLPWLRYSAVRDARTRPEHMAWHGTVLRVDHPFWRTHFPPNGWSCRCTVQQLGDEDLEALGFEPSNGAPPGSGETRPWANKRTGEVVQVPVGIDPGWGHNVGLAGRAAPVRGVDRGRDPWAITELGERQATARQLAGQGGSNPGGLYEGADGVRRYVKFYDDPSQAWCEAVSNRAYRELGLDAPVSALVRRDGKLVGIANEIIEHDGIIGDKLGPRGQNWQPHSASKAPPKGRSQSVMNGYAADVWLMNWDVLGRDMDNIVKTRTTWKSVARIDQGGSLLWRGLQGRKSRRALGSITEWDGFADPQRNPSYAAVVQAAGYGSADELGRKALKQIAAIRELGKRTNDFADLVRPVRGITSEDRDAVLRLLRTRARLLHTEIAPRVRAAQRAGSGLPAFEAAFVKELGGNYQRFLRGGRRAITAGAPRHGMTDPELAGVRAYTTSDDTWGYGPVNSGLRSGDAKQIARFRNYRDTVNAALARLPDHTGVVRRGTTLPSDELARHRPGAVVTYDAFTSASTGSGYSGRHRFLIQSRHGKSVEPYSAYRSELEVLFAAGTRFQVLAREDRGSYIEFRLKEL